MQNRECISTQDLHRLTRVHKQHADQWDDAGVNKYHIKTLLVWIKLIQTNRNQNKLNTASISFNMHTGTYDGAWEKLVSGTQAGI